MYINFFLIQLPTISSEILALKATLGIGVENLFMVGVTGILRSVLISFNLIVKLLLVVGEILPLLR